MSRLISALVPLVPLGLLVWLDPLAGAAAALVFVAYLGIELATAEAEREAAIARNARTLDDWERSVAQELRAALSPEERTN